MEVIDVIMDDVELLDASLHHFELQDMVDRAVEAVVGQTQGAGAGGDQARVGLRIAAGEKRHLMALPDKFLGQVMDDALGAAVEAWRNAFIEGGNLGNSHSQSLSRP